MECFWFHIWLGSGLIARWETDQGENGERMKWNRNQETSWEIASEVSRVQDFAQPDQSNQYLYYNLPNLIITIYATNRTVDFVLTSTAHATGWAPEMINFTHVLMSTELRETPRADVYFSVWAKFGIVANYEFWNKKLIRSPACIQP